MRDTSLVRSRNRAHFGTFVLNESNSNVGKPSANTNVAFAPGCFSWECERRSNSGHLQTCGGRI